MLVALPATASGAIKPRKFSIFGAGHGGSIELIATSKDGTRLRWASRDCRRGAELVFGIKLRRDGSFHYHGSTDPQSIVGIIKVTLNGHFTSARRAVLTTTCSGHTRTYRLVYRRPDSGYAEGFGTTDPNGKPSGGGRQGTYSGPVSTGGTISLKFYNSNETGPPTSEGGTLPAIPLTCASGPPGTYPAGDFGGEGDVAADGSFHETYAPPSSNPLDNGPFGGSGPSNSGIRVDIYGRLTGATGSGTLTVHVDHDPGGGTDCSGSATWTAQWSPPREGL